MQLATRTALSCLGIFLANPGIQNASQLVGIPVLYNILESERDHGTGEYSAEVLSLSRWIHERGMQVLDKLVKYPAPGPSTELTGMAVGENWRAVRCSLMYVIWKC